MFTKEDLANHITRVRGTSTKDLIKALQYEASEFSPQEVSNLARFFSNSDRPIFTFKYQGLLSGSIVSRESRSADDIRRAALKTFNESERVKDTLSQLNIPDILDTLGFGFYERTFEEYGDDSIAQVVPGTVAFEGISLLYSMQISHHRFIPKISKSTRYRRFDKQRKDGNFPYIVDPFISEAGRETECRTVMDSLFETYHSLAVKDGSRNAELTDYLRTEALPFETFREGVNAALSSQGSTAATDDELQKAYERTLAPLQLDIVRHLLPLATVGATAALMNGQSAAALVLEGYTTPRGESFILSELLRRELEPLFGPLLSNVDPGSEIKKRQARFNAAFDVATAQKEVKARRYQALPKIALNPSCVFQDNEFPKYLVEKHLHERFTRVIDLSTECNVEVSTNDTLTDLVIAIIEDSDPKISLGEARAIVRGKNPLEQRNLALEYAGTELRQNRRHKPGRAFERITFDISIKGITIGELRDLRRHRPQTNLEPTYFTPELGFYIDQGLTNPSFREMLEREYRKTTALYEELADRVNPEVASTVLPLATRTTMNMVMNYRQAHHFVELRSQKGGHPNYVKICQMVYVGMKDQFPLAKETMTYINNDTALDYARGLQEIRALRKKAK